MKKFVLNRRTMLRGMLGASAVGLSLPMLDAMLNANGTAYADGTALPVRFMTWFFGNGVRLGQWTPSGTGQGDAWQLTDELMPLANVKEYLSILSGFDIKAASQHRRGHHDGVAGFFSGHPFIELPPSGGPYSSKFGGPSIDQRAATILKDKGIQSYLPSLHVGVSKRLTQGEGPTLHHLSHKGPDESVPSMHNPIDVYNLLFGNFVPQDDPSRELRVAMLDAVKDDAKRLKTRVGKSDQLRLDAHLDSIDTLRQQIDALPPACTKPVSPTEDNEDNEGNEPLEEVAHVMADLIVYAWKCDITRVCSWQQSGSVGGTVYWMTGATTEEHGLSHETGGQELIHKAVVFNMECFAYLLEKLKGEIEGDGNLLDNSVILLGSDCAEGITHSVYDQPAIVAGRGGGALKSDLHYRSPNDENTSDILLACMKALDPAVTEVGGDNGNADGRSTTPLSAILV